VCTFDAVQACSQLNFNRNYIQYTGNPCDASTFYQCEKTKTGFVAYLQNCKPCLEWSSQTWSCSIRNNNNCPTEVPITEVITNDQVYCQRTGNGPAGVYTQQYRPGAGLVTFFWVVFGQDLEFPCPPGTYFNFDQCQCIACYPGGPCAGSNPRVFTLDFDGQGSEQGIYYDVDPSGVLSSNSHSGVSLQLDGVQTDIEVPFFQNNEFSEFRFNGFFYRDPSGGAGDQGILFNGNSPASGDWPASIYVISTGPNTVTAGIITEVDHYSISSTNAVANAWNEVTLRYDGVTLSLAVNGESPIPTAASGTTLRTKSPLLFGKSFDANGVAHYFKGNLDSLSWYRVAQ
jgi:hypothetical protein